MNRWRLASQLPAQRLRALAGALILVGSAAVNRASADPGFGPARTVPVPLHSGFFAGDGAATARAAAWPVPLAGASWSRLTFAGADLGAASFIVVTNLQDGAAQMLDATSLQHWNNATAYFNGGLLLIELYVAPDDRGVFFELESALTDDPQQGGVAGICGDDDRVASSDPAVGRLFTGNPGSFSICTGWISGSGALLTAGHCTLAANTVLQFNVPTSTTCGNLGMPLPQDQFPVDPASVEFLHTHQFVPCENDPTEECISVFGDDFAIFLCFPSTTDGPLPGEAQHAFIRLDLATAALGLITGFGKDSNTPTACFAQQAAAGFVDGLVLENGNVYLEYDIDGEGGSSGGPVMDLILGVALAVNIASSADTCNDSRGMSFGDLEFLSAVLDYFPETVHLDAGHPDPDSDGTAFAPCASLSCAVAAVPPGGTIRATAGSYPTPITINDPMTIMAPVGTVTIGD